MSCGINVRVTFGLFRLISESRTLSCGRGKAARWAAAYKGRELEGGMAAQFFGDGAEGVADYGIEGVIGGFGVGRADADEFTFGGVAVEELGD